MEHHRKSIRLRNFDYSQAGWYYVTICTFQKICCLGEIIDGKVKLNTYGETVKEEWLETKKLRKNVDLDEYVVMPNHLHGIIILRNHKIETVVGATRRVAPTQILQTTTARTMKTLQSNSIGSIIGQIKSVTTKQIRKNGLPNFQWQRNYYEHIIRNQEDYM